MSDLQPRAFGYGAEVMSRFMFNGKEVYSMATTGELRAIVEELQLIDAGDAASFLGEETEAEESLVPDQQDGSVQTGSSSNHTSCTESSDR